MLTVDADGEAGHAHRGEHVVGHSVLRAGGAVQLVCQRELHIYNVQVAAPRVVRLVPVDDGGEPDPQRDGGQVIVAATQCDDAADQGQPGEAPQVAVLCARQDGAII